MSRLARLLTADELGEMWKTVGALDALWGEPALADGLGDVLHTAETLRAEILRLRGVIVGLAIGEVSPAEAFEALTAFALPDDARGHHD